MDPNRKTLIGGNGDILKSEDITRKEVKVIIDQKCSDISTMIFNRNLNSLLVGDNNGCLSQYGRNPSGDFKKQKHYGNVKMGKVFASDCLGDFAVVGGEKGIISLIDMKRRKVIQNKIKTAIREVYSLQFCRISRNKIYLTVGGIGTRDYSDSKTDLFHVSHFFNLGEFS